MMTLHVFPQLKPYKTKLECAYELSADIVAHYKGKTVTIPAGAQYDGASIPPALYQWIGTPFHPQFMRAAAFHDWLYYTHQLSRRETDDLFCELLKEDGVHSSRLVLIYQGVRLAGGLFWKNDEEDDEYLDAMRNAILNRGDNPADYGL